MSASDINKTCKDGASKSNDDGVCDVNNMLQNMSTADSTDDIPVCANCGKEGSSDNMNICNKCKQVKYCNAACKKKHRSKHKKKCERYATELHDIELFKQPPAAEDCPICFLRMPTFETGYRYQSCCGKTVCSGCRHAPVYDNQGNKVVKKTCPFCRVPTPYADEEIVERLKKRVEANDPAAMYKLGICYRDGLLGYPQNHNKALELWHRAAELDHTPIYLNIGYAHEYGEGVEVDKEKATYHYELAAMGGCERARYNLGNNEGRGGKVDRALKHHMIAIRSGFAPSLKQIQDLYIDGHATKEDYTKALQAYQKYLGDIKSVQRDKAAAAYEEYRYYE